MIKDMRKSYKYRLVAKLEAAGEKKEKRFEDYESMIAYLGFVILIAQKVEVYYKVGGEWTLVKEVKVQRIW